MHFMLKDTGTHTGLCIVVLVYVHNFEVACVPILIIAHVVRIVVFARKTGCELTHVQDNSRSSTVLCC